MVFSAHKNANENTLHETSKILDKFQLFYKHEDELFTRVPFTSKGIVPEVDRTRKYTNPNNITDFDVS